MGQVCGRCCLTYFAADLDSDSNSDSYPATTTIAGAGKANCLGLVFHVGQLANDFLFVSFRCALLLLYCCFPFWGHTLKINTWWAAQQLQATASASLRINLTVHC